MHRFLILCLAAITTADTKLGYNYESRGHGIAVSGQGFTKGSRTSNVATGNGISSGFNRFDSDATNDGTPMNEEENNDYNKEFYTYSAPEEEFIDDGGAERLTNSLRKSLRVLFIRAPENQGLMNAALQLAKQSSEDRTAIYVLQKQADISELTQRLQNLKAANAQKPEVHFVKYRTKEDAERAQQTIQSQYEELGGGESHNFNEGVAPVLNFANTATELNELMKSNAKDTGVSSGNAYVPPKSKYLPASARVK